jgi:hypothetical protein
MNFIISDMPPSSPRRSALQVDDAVLFRTREL